MVDEINKKFVDFANTAVKKIREVGNETSKTNEKAKLFSDTLKEQKFLAEQIQFMDPTEFSMFTPKQAAPVSVPESSKAIQKRQQELNKRLAQLQKGLRNEEQAEMESFKDKLAILDEYYKDRQAFDQDYMRTREQLETQHSQKMAAIQSRNYDSQLGLLKSGKFAEMDLTKVAEDQKLKFVMDAGGAMINELGKHNKEAFYLAKAYNIGQAIMNVAMGITQALSFGFPLGPILAGIIATMGAVQIAAIASQQYTGRQFGGYVSGGTPYLIGEDGPEVFVPAGSGQIVPNRGSMDSPSNVNINFTINAVDAVSVDTLIMQRKALITSIVREGIENQGRRSVI